MTNLALSSARFISALEPLVGSKGVSISVKTDFAEFHELFNLKIGDDKVPEPFSNGFYEIGPKDGFWLEGRDNNDNVVHLQALKLDHLGGMNLASYWHQQIKSLHCDMYPGNLVERNSLPCCIRHQR